jgi:hypothetical protein
MQSNNNLLQDLQIEHSQDISDAVSIYTQTKEILERTNRALGRDVQYSVITSSTGNSYNLNNNGQPTVTAAACATTSSATTTANTSYKN